MLEANPGETSNATANTTDNINAEFCWEHTREEYKNDTTRTCVQLACWICSAVLGMQQYDGGARFNNQRATAHDYSVTILPLEIMGIL